MTAPLSKERIDELRRDWAPADDDMGRADVTELLDAYEALRAEADGHREALERIDAAESSCVDCFRKDVIANDALAKERVKR